MIRDQNNHPAHTLAPSLWNQALCVQGNGVELNWSCTNTPDQSTSVHVWNYTEFWTQDAVNDPSGPHWQHRELFPGCCKYWSLCPLPALVAFCPFHNQSWAFSLLFTITPSLGCWFPGQHLPTRLIIHHFSRIKISGGSRCSSRLSPAWFKEFQTENTTTTIYTFVWTPQLPPSYYSEITP